ncbi:uncharacterized protein B0H64DRAFT_20790, partial [Chaetomium fimeti]
TTHAHHQFSSQLPQRDFHSNHINQPRRNIADSINNVNMPTKDSEKPTATTVQAAVAMDVEANTATETTSSSHRQMCEGAYLCECCLCICGAPVDYPGDVCHVCSKYH